MKEFLQSLGDRGQLRRISQRLSPNLDVSYVLHNFESEPIIFDNVEGSSLSVAGNLYGTRGRLKEALGLLPDRDLSEFVRRSLDHPSESKGNISSFDESSWDNNLEADLSKIPILKHFDREAGKYITAGIVAAKFPGKDGENLSFHRMLVLSKNKVTARIVPRHLNQIAKDLEGKKIPISMIIGPPPVVFLSASLQTQYGLSEYRIANKMSNEKLELTESENSDIAIPIDTEIFLEGHLDFSEKAREGPFVDLTGTYDEIREQPVITFDRMHYRKDSVYQAVLASSSEHSIFMSLPQELKIQETLSKSIPKIRDINLTPSSNGYFHCVVSIQKTNDGDGKTAILNCFAASHPLKLVIAVDEDIDPFDLSQVEWALATRFQAERGIVSIHGAKGSSLDPSSEKTALTSKLGLDATLSLKADRSKFERAEISTSPTSSSVIEMFKKA